MINLINSIANRDFVEADSLVSETVELIMAKKLEEAKKMCAAKMTTEQGLDATAAELRRKDVVEEEEELDEEQLDEARIKIIKARIRGGKIQRRKKVSNIAGMTLRGGKLQRMSPAERRRRKMGAKRAVRKKAGKMSRILMKRQRSLRKRKALGL